jgi:hypothetical protein
LGAGVVEDWAAHAVNETPFGRQVRLAYLEARLFLDGEIHTGILIALGVTRQVASRDINYYLRNHGRIFVYRPKLKRFILDRRSKPRLLPRHHHASFARYVESVHGLAYKRHSVSAR